MRALLKFLRAEQAATAVEYAVMLAMILIAIITAVATVGSETGAWWGNIDSDLETHDFGD